MLIPETTLWRRLVFKEPGEQKNKSCYWQFYQIADNSIYVYTVLCMKDWCEVTLASLFSFLLLVRNGFLLRKETDFLGYRGMKTSSSTQLLSRAITESISVCVGHKDALSAQKWLFIYCISINVYFMWMIFFIVWKELWAATRHQNPCWAQNLMLEFKDQDSEDGQNMMFARCWLYLDWFTLLPFKNGVILLQFVTNVRETHRLLAWLRIPNQLHIS